jgi:hypothetical protein
MQTVHHRRFYTLEGFEYFDHTSSAGLYGFGTTESGQRFSVFEPLVVEESSHHENSQSVAFGAKIGSCIMPRQQQISNLLGFGSSIRMDASWICFER